MTAFRYEEEEEMTAETITPQALTKAALAAEQPAEISVDLGSEWVRWTGKILASSSSRSTDPVAKLAQDRWTELSLYWRDEELDYVLVKSGRSLRYHLPGLPCNTGVLRSVLSVSEDDSLYEDLIPCKDCLVGDLDDLDDEAMISVEVDRNVVMTCTSPDEVLERLAWNDGSKNVKPGLVISRQGSDGKVRYVTLSFLSSRLLKNAAEKDPVIRKMISKIRDL